MRLKGEALGAFILCCMYLLSLSGNKLINYLPKKGSNGFFRVVSITLNDSIITKKDITKIESEDSLNKEDV